jgi:hypothetical protein
MSTTTKPMVIAFNSLLMDLGRKTIGIHLNVFLNFLLKNSLLLSRGMGKVPLWPSAFVAKCWNETRVEWNSSPPCNFV